MIDFITTEMIKAVGIAVSEYAFGRVGDHLFDTFSTKLKIKGILRKDEKFIERQFKNQKIELLIAGKSFLFEEVFQDSIFLYPVSDIPESRSTLLWQRYCNYIQKNQYDLSLSLDDDTYKHKLVACVNNHNELVNKALLNDSERIILKTIDRNQSDLLGYIGKTLDANSNLQFENYNLDYAQKQIEGILHALRMDMRHYKLLLILYAIGILIITLTTILVLPQITLLLDSLNENAFIAITPIMLIIAWLFALLLRLFFSTMKNVKMFEEKISTYMDALWHLHFTSYSKQFESLFTSCIS